MSVYAPKKKNYDYKLDVHSFERKQSFHNSIIYSNQILKRKEKKVKNTTIWKCETRICTKTHGNTTAQPICILFIDIIIDFNSIHTICSWFGYGFIWFAFELKQNTHFCVWWLRAITTTTTEREKRRRDEYCNENEKKNEYSYWKTSSLCGGIQTIHFLFGLFFMLIMMIHIQEILLGRDENQKSTNTHTQIQRDLFSFIIHSLHSLRVDAIHIFSFDLIPFDFMFWFWFLDFFMFQWFSNSFCECECDCVHYVLWTI